MNDIMTPVPFGKLMNWVLEENKRGVVFDIKKPFIANPDKIYEIFGRKSGTSLEPAAGPYIRLTQNIVAFHVTSSRFLELRTIQKLNGENLPVSEPCIKADDEYYNCEWSTGLHVPQVLDEYVKVWFACKVLAREYDLGGPDSFQFNMSVGYNLDGIKTEEIDRSIEGMKDASETAVFKECRQWFLDNLDRFEKVPREDVEAISPNVCNCATLSTFHGYPPQKIERIIRYLIEKKRVHTFIKCDPTLPGHEYARKIIDDMGYNYITFGDSHFKDDLQYRDAVFALQRLQTLAGEKDLEFGMKITNTFPVDIKQNESLSEEMYISDKSLYPLSMPVAKMLAEGFGRKLCISYSSDADFSNIADIVDAGIWPVTMATTMLRPGSYGRLEQIGQLFTTREATAFEGVDAVKAAGLVEAVKSDKHHVKAVEPLSSRKINKPAPLTDCSVAPYQEGCPVHQDIIRYLWLAGIGELEWALEIILNKNPLPFIMDATCAHNYMSECTRNFYEFPVGTRRTKPEAAEGGFRVVMAKLKAPEITSDKKAVVVGGGPAGLVAAYFLARGDARVTLFKKEEKMGDVVRNVIPGSRTNDSVIDSDVKLVAAVGVKMMSGREVTDTEGPKKGYDYVILTVGASEQGILKLGTGDTMNVLDFLTRFKATDGRAESGRNVVAIGGGDMATDTARAAKRNTGVGKIPLVYRRTRRYTPVNEEELVMIMEDGVELAELLAPMKPENGVPYCKGMVLGDIDTSGCRGVVGTDQVVEVSADTAIAAVGEKVPGISCENCGTVPGSRRCPQVDQETLETSVEDVYVAGDGLYSPTTVAEGIRDGRMAAETIIGEALAEDLFRLSNAEAIYGHKGRLAEENARAIDSTHCLSYNSYCENCVEVCPNRANISLVVPNMEKHQIIRMDYICSECGSCKSFCPWDSAPYLDKFTLFANEADMTDGKNQSLTVLNAAANVCRVRLQDRVMDCIAGFANADVPDGIRKIIQTVIDDYSYMLQIVSESL